MISEISILELFMSLVANLCCLYCFRLLIWLWHKLCIFGFPAPSKYTWSPWTKYCTVTCSDGAEINFRQRLNRHERSLFYKCFPLPWEVFLTSMKNAALCVTGKSENHTNQYCYIVVSIGVRKSFRDVLIQLIGHTPMQTLVRVCVCVWV